MKNINFFKKIRLFLSYRRTLNKIKLELFNRYNAKVDNAYRIYTVINIPSSIVEEPYNLKKTDIDTIAKTYISDYTKDISSFLNRNNLIELYDFYEVKKVDKLSYLVIYGFSLFNSSTFLLRFYFLLTIMTISTLILILLFLI